MLVNMYVLTPLPTRLNNIISSDKQMNTMTEKEKKKRKEKNISPTHIFPHSS